MRACLPILSLMLFACTQHEGDELTGSYEAAYAFGTARVILAAGGDFTEFMTLTGQESKRIATGRWSYDPGNSRLTLSNFSEIAYESGLPIPDDLILNGPTTVPVDWRNDPLTLHLGRGEGSSFKRLMDQ